MEEILPCVGCGSIHQLHTAKVLTRYFYIICDKTLISSGDQSSPKKAIREWNKRQKSIKPWMFTEEEV